MSALITILSASVRSVWVNLPYLAVGILVAATLQVYLDQDKLRQFLTNHSHKSIPLVVLFATLTPFCSCGTMAVIIAMLASTIPWAPVVAFMVASPLMSPTKFILASGAISPSFAVSLLLASVLIGLGAGYLTHFLEKRGFLKNQARLKPSLSSEAPPAVPPGHSPQHEPATSCCGFEVDRPAITPPAPAEKSCCCAAPAASPEPACPENNLGNTDNTPGNTRVLRRDKWCTLTTQLKLLPLLQSIIKLSPRLLLMFTAFALIGKVLTFLMPSQWMLGLFGAGRFYAIPAAATLGLPLYINAETSMPLIRTFIDAGMSPGSALAFVIAGAGTHFGAVAGALTIARHRIVTLVILILWLGAILAGLAYNLLSMAG